MAVNRFNIRVYGILEYNGKILLVHETIGDFPFTKFPGGGLEFGEGMKECLIREFAEEAGIKIEVVQHVYTTDFFIESAFQKTDQLISVYYMVKPLEDPSLIRLDEFDVENNGKIERLRFFWVDRNELNENMLTFPIDRRVSRILKAE